MEAQVSGVSIYLSLSSQQKVFTSDEYFPLKSSTVQQSSRFIESSLVSVRLLGGGQLSVLMMLMMRRHIAML